MPLVVQWQRPLRWSHLAAFPLHVQDWQDPPLTASPKNPSAQRSQWSPSVLCPHGCAHTSPPADREQLLCPWHWHAGQEVKCQDMPGGHSESSRVHSPRLWTVPRRLRRYGAEPPPGRQAPRPVREPSSHQPQAGLERQESQVE